MAADQFDRSLSDFRNDVALASLTLRASIARYVAMMEAVDSAFLLYYDDMTSNEQMMMRAAFAKLEDTVRCCTEEDTPTNIHTIKGA